MLFRMKPKHYLQILIISAITAFSSCNNTTETIVSADGYKTILSFSPGDESKIVEAFLTLKDSSIIELKQGNYKFDNLSLAQLKYIQLKGEGADKTILDFSSQTQGGE